MNIEQDQKEVTNININTDTKIDNTKKTNMTFVILLIIALIGGIYFIYINDSKVDDQDQNNTVDGNDTDDADPSDTDDGDDPSDPNNVVLSETLSKRLVQFGNSVTDVSDIKPQASPYSLPLDTSKDIANWEQVNEKMALDNTAKDLLSKNGFVVLNTKGGPAFAKDDFGSFYNELPEQELPVFVTTDSLLHYYHVFFDTALMRMEKDIFYEDSWQMTEKFYEDSLDIYENSTDPTLKEAAKRNVVYLSVALELLKPKPDQIVSDDNVKELTNCYADPESCQGVYEQTIQHGTFDYFGQIEANEYLFEVPAFVKELVDEELVLIEGHGGWSCSPTFFYEEDYSQYVPRGHYTKSEKLKNYFLGLMWYGRMTNLIKGSPSLPVGECSVGNSGGFISEEDAEIQTLQALILAKKFASDNDIRKKWNKMYAITSYFVGFSDDLGPVEYSSALEDVFGDDIDLNLLTDKLPELKENIQQKFPGPQIYSGLGNAQMIVIPEPPLTEEQINELKQQSEKLLSNTAGFRMMGQRFVVDSYLFSKIVSPFSGEYTGGEGDKPFTYVVSAMGREVRGFPRGLDIMALFGSERAAQIIEDAGDADYSNYQEQFNELKKEIDALPESEWHKNIYWNWLYVLKSLVVPFESGYPTFMQTTAWQDKELSTALASWSELRHDTILYAKQSYTMAELGGGGDEPKIEGYVEPVPIFYARLLDLTTMTRVGLEELLEEDELEKIGVGDSLEEFEEILSRLIDISKAELNNEELTESDYWFIKYFGVSLAGVSSHLLGGYGGEVDPDMFKNTLIADVHTDGNTFQVLEEGVGYIKPMAVAYKMPEGHIVIGVGPVFSYYEFKHPMDDRLTDEKWREMLESNPPADPEWTKSFSN